MTRTGPADVAMSACAHATASRPVPARPGFCERVSVWPASGAPTVVRAVFPGSASLKPASRHPQPGPHPPPGPRQGARSAVSPAVLDRISALLVPARVACRSTTWMFN